MTRLSPESWNSIWAPPTSGGKISPRQLPFFDFSCLKSRSSIILLSTSLILLGIFSPFLLLILEPEVEREMGLAWVGRVCYSSLFSGAYAYTLKVFVLQKVRARNFAQAWSLVQMSQSVSVLTGVCRLRHHGRRRMRRSFWWLWSASTTWRKGSRCATWSTRCAKIQ